MRAVIYDPAEKKWLNFTRPVSVYSSFSIEHVNGILKIIDRETERRGLYAAGFISYQASPAFEKNFKVQADDKSVPLISFALYREAETINSPIQLLKNDETFYSGTWQPSVSFDEYCSKINEIKKHLEYGNSYQVNFTFPVTADFAGNPFALFCHLLPYAEVEYAAYIESDNYALCSFSPELFFIKNKSTITLRPMKGTAPRGKTPEEDKRNIQWLADSEKNRAENLMITDMIRNDISRIAERGSVEVTEAFTVETYPTLFQMTSTVKAETDASIPEIFSALFPCASITGAPKVSTMNIIKELEPAPRGVYTGSIGVIKPQGDALFNVAIRTATIDKKRWKGVYSVGGGIVWDSDPGEEFRECGTKSKIIRKAGKDFYLFETIKYDKKGFHFINEHMGRISSSAQYYSIPFRADDAMDTLSKAVEKSCAENLRIKLILHSHGELSLEASPLYPLPDPYIVSIAASPVDRDNPFLKHKTSVRYMYSNALNGAGNCSDVILYNREMELTESTIANIVLKIDGDLYTPPVSSGLLPGTMRHYLIKSGTIKKKVLYLKDLDKAEEIFLINSLRGWINPLLK